MKFLEKDLEDIIFKHPTECYNRGLELGCFYTGESLLRQVKLGRYGVADLVSVELYNNTHNTVFDNVMEELCDKTLLINIIECKKGPVNIHTFLQAKRYETGIRHLLESFDSRRVFIDIHLTLIGQSIDKSPDFIHAFQSTNAHAFTYSYEPDGIYFDNQTWDCQVSDGVDGYNAPEIANTLKRVLPVKLGYTQNLQRDWELLRSYRLTSPASEVNTDQSN